MKLKCVINKTEPRWEGDKPKPIPGLTKNKIYEGGILSKTDYVESSNGFGISHSYEVNGVAFLIFNNDKKWKSYPVELFEPV